MGNWRKTAKTEFERERKLQLDPYRRWRKEREKEQAGDVKLLESFTLLNMEEPLPEPLPETEFLILLRSDGQVPGSAMQEMLDLFRKDEEVQLIYGDEDVERDGERCDPWFKPDWSPDSFESLPYFGSMIAMRRAWFMNALSMKDVHDPASLMECIAAHTFRSDTYPLHLDRITYTGKTPWEDLPVKHIIPPFGGDKPPLVSVVIPSKDHPELLENCIRSLKSLTEYPFYELIVVDNGSCAEKRVRVEKLRLEYGFRYLYQAEDFNFARMCNRGAAEAKGEVLLFLNDDIEVKSPDWLRIMAATALQEHVGAVGAKLLYPLAKGESVHRIQHAGITNIAPGPVHKLCGLPDEGSYYHGKNLADRDVLAVTAACLAVRKERFDAVGGFCEELAVAYNDVDLCFSLYEKGWYNVQRNDAVLIHHESASRGEDISGEKRQRRQKEWQLLYERHPKLYAKDPFYSRNLENYRLYTEYKPGCACDFEKPGVRSQISAMKAPKESPRGRLERKLGLDLNPAWHIDSADRVLLFSEEGKAEAEWRSEGWAAPAKAPLWEYETGLILRGKDDEAYLAKSFPKVREDVVPVLPEQPGAAMSGFVLRLPEGAVPDGEYELSLCFMRRDGKKEFVYHIKERLILEKEKLPLIVSDAEG